MRKNVFSCIPLRVNTIILFISITTFIETCCLIFMFFRTIFDDTCIVCVVRGVESSGGSRPGVWGGGSRTGRRHKGLHLYKYQRLFSTIVGYLLQAEKVAIFVVGRTVQFFRE